MMGGTASPHERQRSFPFPKTHRLRKPGEFARVKAEGRRRRTTHFTVNYRINGLAHHRLGLVVQKKFWNAAQRNRIKRCLRESFRLNRHLIPLPGKDIVVVARPGAEKLSCQDTGKELLAALTKQDGPSA